MSRRAALLVVAAITLSSFLAACGGKSEDATAVVAASSSKTLAAKSSKVAFTVGTAKGATSNALRAEGAFDYTTKQGRLTLDLTQLGLGATLGGAKEAEILLTEEVFYMRIPGLAQAAAGRPWIKVDLAAQAKSAGVPLGGLEQLGGNDPTATLQLLRGAGDDMSKKGSDTIRGVSTDRYKGSLDLAKAVKAAPEANRAELQSTIDKLGGSEKLPIDVWVDAQGRVRKLVSQVDTASQNTGTVTIEYYDFGTPVTIDVPPDDQTVDIAELTPPTP